jgi:hypothetical protein
MCRNESAQEDEHEYANGQINGHEDEREELHREIHCEWACLQGAWFVLPNVNHEWHEGPARRVPQSEEDSGSSFERDYGARCRPVVWLERLVRHFVA